MFGELEIAPQAREVRIGGAPVELTPREFDLLDALSTRPNAAFSRAQLLSTYGAQPGTATSTSSTSTSRICGASWGMTRPIPLCEDGPRGRLPDGQRRMIRGRGRRGFASRLFLGQALVIVAGAATLAVVAFAIAPGIFHSHVRQAVGTLSDDAMNHIDEAFSDAVLIALGLAIAGALLAAACMSAFSRCVWRGRWGALADARDESPAVTTRLE